MPARKAVDQKDQPLDDAYTTSRRPSLRAETLGPGATAEVITIRDVEFIDVQDADQEDGIRRSIVLSSEEYPELGYWLNRTGAKAIKEKFGAVPREWIGQRVPLVVVRVQNPRTGEAVKSLQVAAVGEWDEILSQFGKARKAKLGTRRGSSKPSGKTKTTR